MLAGAQLSYEPQSYLQFNLLTPAEKCKLRLISISKIDTLMFVHTQLFLFFLPKANFYLHL
jgi:hypothetical protein